MATCVTAGDTPGPVNVLLTNPDAESGTKNSGFTYLP